MTVNMLWKEDARLRQLGIEAFLRGDKRMAPWTSQTSLSAQLWLEGYDAAEKARNKQDNK